MATQLLIFNSKSCPVSWHLAHRSQKWDVRRGIQNVN